VALLDEGIDECRWAWVMGRPRCQRRSTLLSGPARGRDGQDVAVAGAPAVVEQPRPCQALTRMALGSHRRERVLRSYGAAGPLLLVASQLLQVALAN
jgi:hypothetical protein